jgi:hypothetical protein
MAFDWGKLTGDIIGGGATIFTADKAAKAARDAASAQAQNNETALRLAEMTQQTELLKQQNAKANASTLPASSNTTLYIALGVGGVLILGLTIFAVTRK